MTFPDSHDLVEHPTSNQLSNLSHTNINFNGNQICSLFITFRILHNCFFSRPWQPILKGVLPMLGGQRMNRSAKNIVAMSKRFSHAISPRQTLFTILTTQPNPITFKCSFRAFPTFKLLFNLRILKLQSRSFIFDIYILKIKYSKSTPGSPIFALIYFIQVAARKNGTNFWNRPITILADEKVK